MVLFGQQFLINTKMSNGSDKTVSPGLKCLVIPCFFRAMMDTHYSGYPKPMLKQCWSQLICECFHINKNQCFQVLAFNRQSDLSPLKWLQKHPASSTAACLSPYHQVYSNFNQAKTTQNYIEEMRIRERFPKSIENNPWNTVMLWEGSVFPTVLCKLYQKQLSQRWCWKKRSVPMWQRWRKPEPDDASHLLSQYCNDFSS